VKTLNRKKPRGGGESTIISRLQELHELFDSLIAGLNWKKRKSKKASYIYA